MKAILIIGIDAEDDAEKIMRDAGNVESDTAPYGEPVDLCRISESDSGISQYFINQTKPFYERKWDSKLKFWLGGGDA